MADPALFEWAQIAFLRGVWRAEDMDAGLAMPDCRDFPLSRRGEAALGQASGRALDFGFRSFGKFLVETMASQDSHDWTRFDAS